MDEIEIPEAIRESAELPQKSSSVISFPLIIGGTLCLGLIGLLSLFLLLLNKEPVSPIAVENQPPAKAVAPKPKPQAKPIQPKSTSAAVDPPVRSTVKAPKKDDLLGHLPYDVAPQSELTPITSNSAVMMHPSAADKFQQMQAAARADGVNLVAISAFRTAKAQEELFFGVKEQRVQDVAKRAEVSAPPGYSEHHTGYAIDIGDGDAPATNVESTFDQTAAFKWLEQNALKYSFELSFPPNNEQGVSYEPWHWRFVGDRDSLETFYKVRN